MKLFLLKRHRRHTVFVQKLEPVMYLSLNVRDPHITYL